MSTIKITSKFEEGNASAGIRPPDDVLGASMGIGSSARL